MNRNDTQGAHTMKEQVCIYRDCSSFYMTRNVGRSGALGFWNGILDYENTGDPRMRFVSAAAAVEYAKRNFPGAEIEVNENDVSN